MEIQERELVILIWNFDLQTTRRTETSTIKYDKERTTYDDHPSTYTYHTSIVRSFGRFFTYIRFSSQIPQQQQQQQRDFRLTEDSQLQ